MLNKNLSVYTAHLRYLIKTLVCSLSPDVDGTYAGLGYVKGRVNAEPGMNINCIGDRSMSIVIHETQYGKRAPKG